MSNTVSTTTASFDPAAQAWVQALVDTPDQAIDDLLLGAAWLGSYAGLDAPQALPQFLPQDLTDTLDCALQRWLNAQLQLVALPEGITARQYAQALTEAFGLLQTLDLSRTRRWCRERANRIWGWLQAQPSFPSREPRAIFLRSMALVQPNRDLLDFWMALCRKGVKDWAQLALFGLRRLPIDESGTAPSGLPIVVVQGLIDYGLALARRGDRYKRDWLAELDFLTTVYPMSRERWQSRFRDALEVRPQIKVHTLRQWLDERHAAVNRPATNAIERSTPEPPHWDQQIQPLLPRFDRQQTQVRPQLLALMAQHLHFAKVTGDNTYLVRSNCRLANFLLKSATGGAQEPRDPIWALDLGQVAASWAPNNPQSWSVVARALDALGDWTRAQAVFWFARRRFPYNPFSHNQLGHALTMRGYVDEGEAVYRAAIRRFPDDPVCWADLGHTLRVAGRGDDALAVYVEAQQRFHSHPAICSALAGVLIDLGRADEARIALEWAENVRSGDERNQQSLVDLRRRLAALSEGSPLPMRSLRSRPQHAVGDWSALERAAGIDLRGLDELGRSALWRQRGQQGDISRAGTALSRSAEALHHDERWLAERGLWIAEAEGWDAACRHFDQVVTQRPGDGVLAVLRSHAHGHCGETVDWQALRGRFEELAPAIRVFEDAHAKIPANLVAMVSAEPELDDLDDDVRQALRVYDTAGDEVLAQLVLQDFLVAQQLVVF